MTVLLAGQQATTTITYTVSVALPLLVYVDSHAANLVFERISSLAFIHDTL